MKILKYSYLKDSRYKITIDDKEIYLYEDIIIKENLLIKKDISEKELTRLLKENNFYELYYNALKYLKTKLRSKKEIEKYLKNINDDKNNINKVIEKLSKDGYLNDKTYAKAYIHDYFYLKNIGPLKIKKDLLELKINETIIDEELLVIKKEEQINKIKTYINKQLNLNKNKSVHALKEKLSNNLIIKGYEKEYIIEELENISFNEEDLFKKEYDKLYKKYSKKYTGKDLEYKIKQKLYEKGFKNNY